MRILQPPVIVEGPQTQIVNEGDNVTLKCRYYSDVEAIVHWVKYDNEINTDPSEKQNTSGVAQQRTVVQVRRIFRL